MTQQNGNEQQTENTKLKKQLDYAKSRVTKDEQRIIDHLRLIKNEKDLQTVRDIIYLITGQANDISYLNNYRRHLQNQLKKLGCCCENCFWLSETPDWKMDDTMGIEYFCNATKWDIPVQCPSKCICHRYENKNTMEK